MGGIVEFFWYAFLVVLMFGFVVMIHELGHFIFAKLFGVRVESFNIGFGPKKWRLAHFKIGETDYSIRPIPLGGFVELHGQIRPEEMEGLGIVDEMVAEMSATLEKGDAGMGDLMKELDETDLSEEQKLLIRAKLEEAQSNSDADDKGGALQSAARSIIQGSYDDAHALKEKNFFVKLLVFGGGVLFNFVSVILIFALLYRVGREELTFPLIFEKVPADTALYAAGLRNMDHVVGTEGEVAQDGQDVFELIQRQYARIVAGDASEEIDLLVVGQSPATTRTVTLPLNQKIMKELDEVVYYLEPRIGALAHGDRAELAGLRENDLFLEVDGKPVHSWDEMTSVIRANPLKTISIKIQRDGTVIDTSITPDEHKELVDAGWSGDPEIQVIPAEKDGTSPTIAVGRIGIVPAGTKVITRVETMSQALAMGWQKAAGSLIYQVSALGDLFGGGNLKEIKKSVGGPVMILTFSYQKAKQGFWELLDFFAMLSIALVIFNILPIPMLDGGHILQAFIEMIIRRPIPGIVLKWSYNLALAFILLFVLFVTTNDLWREGQRMGIKDLDQPPTEVITPQPKGMENGTEAPAVSQ